MTADRDKSFSVVNSADQGKIVFLSFVLMVNFMFTHIQNHQRGRYTQIRTTLQGESTSTLSFLSVCSDK